MSIWDSIIFPILTSEAFTPSATLFAAFAAFIIYKAGRKDSKKDAANIILLEIRSAERNLEEARKTYHEDKAKNNESISFPEKIRLMPSESWNKYKYLFIRDFESDQWNIINKFYEHCKNFDEAIEIKESSFGENAREIRKNIQKIAAHYSINIAEELIDIQPTEQDRRSDVIQQNLKKKDDAKSALIGPMVENYGPDRPYFDAEYYYNLLPETILNTPIGEKLKKLSKRRRLSTPW